MFYDNITIITVFDQINPAEFWSVVYISFFICIFRGFSSSFYFYLISSFTCRIIVIWLDKHLFTCKDA